jgi:hypothetical protein
MNVKLAAALCGCFILVERYEDMKSSFSSGNDRYDNNSRGGDTRGRDTRDGGFGGGWDDEFNGGRGRDGGRDGGRDEGQRGRGIDISGPGDGFDDLGWPDLEEGPGGATAGTSEAQSRFGDLLGGGNDASDANDWPAQDDGMDFVAAAEGAINTAAAGAFNDVAPGAASAADDANWEEVGPGKVGVVTFGANLGAGITGSSTFMGDPEMIQASEVGLALLTTLLLCVKSPTLPTLLVLFTTLLISAGMLHVTYLTPGVSATLLRGRRRGCGCEWEAGRIRRIRRLRRRRSVPRRGAAAGVGRGGRGALRRIGG